MDAYPIRTAARRSPALLVLAFFANLLVRPVSEKHLERKAPSEPTPPGASGHAMARS